MSEKQNNMSKKQSLPRYTRICAGCARKLESFYYLTEREEEPRPGQCPLCLGVYYLGSYSLRPIRPQYRRKSGGGERALAGR